MFAEFGLKERAPTQAYAVGADFSGADMTNAVVDRVAFDRANLSRVRFTNAVITGATFEGTNLDGAVFEDALIGGEDVKRLCAPCNSKTLNYVVVMRRQAPVIH